MALLPTQPRGTRKYGPTTDSTPWYQKVWSYYRLNPVVPENMVLLSTQPRCTRKYGPTTDSTPLYQKIWSYYRLNPVVWIVYDIHGTIMRLVQIL
eukprot:2881715-Rhodomonas_salina.1